MKRSILFALLMMAATAFAQSGGSMSSGKFPTSFAADPQTDSIQFVLRAVMDQDQNGLLTIEVVDRNGQSFVLKVSESEIVSLSPGIYGVRTRVQQN